MTQTALIGTSAPTLRLRRSGERGFEDFGWTDNWMTFSFSDYHDEEWMGFGPLRVMIENHIQPHSGFPRHPHRDVEIITYVVSGTITHEDSFGHKGEIGAGEMQHISAGSRGMIHSEENRHGVVEHNYQMWLVPERAGTQFAYHQLGFSPEERQGRFRLYASPDGHEGSMPINCDAFVYAGLFTAGDTAQRTLEPGRGLWAQVVRGAVEVAGVGLEQGDGVGISNADGLTFQFNADSEILLFDIRMDAPLLWK